MQRFVAEPSFWELFPKATLAVAVAHDIRPATETPASDLAELVRLLEEANTAALRDHLTSDVISQNAVVAVWREAFRKFKTKGGARCSMENLLKRALKGKPVGEIFPMVDCSNIVTLTHATPSGAENLDAVVGDFRLTMTSGGDDYLGLGEDEPMPTLPGELAYLDNVGAICRCWNWRDGVRCAIDETTRNATLVMECVEPGRTDDLRRAMADYSALVERFCGATVSEPAFVTADQPSCPL